MNHRFYPPVNLKAIKIKASRKQPKKRETVKPKEKGSSDICIVFGKSYEFITVQTPDAFQRFIQIYLVNNKPSVLGIDVETTPTGNK